MRIARFLARCGVASRRKAEDLVRAGKVRLNGAVVLDLGRQVIPESDVVDVDGRPCRLAVEHLTLVVNKPADVLVTRNDPHGGRTVYDLLPLDFAPRAAELVYAGRLDRNTRGLLILTTDGDLANRLVHPSRHVEKAYEVTTDRELGDEAIESLRQGVDLEDGRTLPARVRWLRGTTLEIVLVEGRNRQVRRMIEAVGARVMELVRVRFGRVELGRLGLREGEFRPLTGKEIRQLLLNQDTEEHGNGE